MSENYDLLRDIAGCDVTILEQKGKSYGSSWRKRGGAGAFMMLARKWDRIENQMEAAGYDIFEPLQKEMVAGTTDGLLDDIRDLRRYLLLVEGHVMDILTTPCEVKCADEGEPGRGYVNQDPDAPGRSKLKDYLVDPYYTSKLQGPEVNPARPRRA